MARQFNSEIALDTSNGIATRWSRRPDPGDASDHRAGEADRFPVPHGPGICAIHLPCAVHLYSNAREAE